MFERNGMNQGAGGEKQAHPVRITLDDGSQLRGRIMVPRSRNINDELNHAGKFLSFEPYRGDQLLLAKASIRSLSVTNIPKASQLQRRVANNGDFDPFEMLGVAHGATPDVIRKAYHNLAKAYHPDRYASQDVPDEILEYACAMLGRINLAYNELNEISAQEAARKERQKAAPANFAQGATPAG